ncbi:MAG TPA: hypothetical protein VMW17_20905 [Candidatus Binatia bacterium]|nr:hypothetical protein [Candidatus Binatia bacterium]
MILLLAACRVPAPGIAVNADRVRAITQAIAELRQRDFATPPRVEVLDRDAMAAAVTRVRARDESLRILRVRSIVDRAFGDPWTTDPLGAVRKLPTDNSFGVYSPSDDTLFLSRARLETPVVPDLGEFLRDGQTLADVVIIHELAHAWQHRHFPALFAPSDDIDRWETQHALIEGDAEVTTVALLQHGVDERALDSYQQLRQRMATTAGQEPARNRDWQFRYACTPRYLAGIVRSGGWKTLNELLDRPPRATGALLEPDAWSAAAADDPPFACPEGWDRAVDTRIGAFQIPPLLRMLPKTMLGAAGWRADRLQVCVRGEDVRWRWTTHWRSEATARDFAAAARAHLQRQHPAVHLSDGDAIHISPLSWLERRGRTVVVADGRAAAS